MLFKKLIDIITPVFYFILRIGGMMMKHIKVIAAAVVLVLAAAVVIMVQGHKGNESLISGKGISVTHSDLESLLSDLGMDPETTSDDAKMRLVNDWVFQEMLYKEAKKAGIPANKEIRAEIKRKTYSFMRNLVVMEAIKHFVNDKVTVSDEEISRYYENMKRKNFTAGEAMAWLGVYHFTEKDEALSLFGRLNADVQGVPGEIDLGYIKISDLDINIRDEVISTPSGKAVKPVKYIDTTGGEYYYVFTVKDKLWKNDIMALDGVRKMIHAHISNIKAAEVTEELMADLKVKYNIGGINKGLL